jgi:hypothetical protein
MKTKTAHVEPTLAGAEVGIAVEDGVATLFGRVESREQKRSAVRSALRVPGILAVAVELVEETRGYPGDTEIARSVADFLRGECNVPPGAVHASVEQARVTLVGEVDLFQERNALEREIRWLAGVRGVVDLISVRPPESQADIRAKVRSAVTRELARLEPKDDLGRRTAEKAPTPNGRRILIIGDDDALRASLKPVLEAAGYVVLEGTSGGKGLDRLVEHDPDAVILDTNTLDIDRSLEAVKRMIRRRRHA